MSAWAEAFNDISFPFTNAAFLLSMVPCKLWYLPIGTHTNGCILMLVYIKTCPFKIPKFDI